MDLERIIDQVPVREPERRLLGETVDEFADRIQELLRPVRNF